MIKERRWSEDAAEDKTIRHSAESTAEGARSNHFAQIQTLTAASLPQPKYAEGHCVSIAVLRGASDPDSESCHSIGGAFIAAFRLGHDVSLRDCVPLASDKWYMSTSAKDSLSSYNVRQLMHSMVTATRISCTGTVSDSRTSQKASVKVPQLIIGSIMMNTSMYTMTSTVQTIPAPAAVSALFPPPGTNFLAALKPAIIFLMIGTTMGSILVAMLLALLFFSTRDLRRKPIFIFNILAILLGIAAGFILNVYDSIHTILSPTDPIERRYFILMGALYSLTPILVDSILLLRLNAVYSWHSTQRMKFIAIMTFPVLVKFSRLGNNAMYLANYSRNASSLTNNTTAAGGGMVLVTSKLPGVKIEWFLQIFDNAYTSALFLIRVHSDSTRPRVHTQRTNQSFSHKLRTFFWIAVSNFIFPVLMAIVQLVIYMATPNCLLALYVAQANLYFTIICVVFATLWTTGRHWADAHLPHTDRPEMSGVASFTVARTDASRGEVHGVATQVSVYVNGESGSVSDHESAQHVDWQRSYEVQAKIHE
ncbi:hypothetical protein EVG20_g10140 [Dentipellis fragilis]|uniref:Uncharacterized protein n=1 Tax=Dentipellis fragilis TaxID=205917 RepID=A0A4Y9XSW0_9AGAM|nr:hypothetical protein EVG20_g10140 [Dentipellis fragilis]